MSNTLITLSDNKIGVDNNADNKADFYTASVLSATDYYAFGMSMKERTWQSESYRYGFNGKENDTDWDVQDYGFRIYKPELGKFLSVDPITQSYPELTPYQFASNRPIDGIDLDGLEYQRFSIVRGAGMSSTDHAPIIEIRNIKNNEPTAIQGYHPGFISLPRTNINHPKAFAPHERAMQLGVELADGIVAAKSLFTFTLKGYKALKSVDITRNKFDYENFGGEFLDGLTPRFDAKILKSGTVKFSGLGVESGTMLKLGKDGFIQGRLVITDKGEGLATRMFQYAENMYENANQEVKGIKGVWLNSDGIKDNYDAFMKIFNETGDLQKAAFGTATGKIAKKMGYTTATPDAKNALGQITMYFTKPK